MLPSFVSIVKSCAICKFNFEITPEREESAHTDFWLISVTQMSKLACRVNQSTDSLATARANNERGAFSIWRLHWRKPTALLKEP